MNDTDLHPFEVAGLGQSPFRFVGMRTNVYSAAPGHSQPGGTCQYCGQGIMHECVIQSRDAKQFVVGTDCVIKLDRADNRLVAAVKRAKLNADRARRREASAAKWAKVEADREAEIQRQRDANGGLSDYELAKQTEKTKRAEESKQWIAKNDWLITVLDREYGSDFIHGMIERLEAGPISGLSPRTIEILTDIYAKSHGRRASKKYDSAVAVFNTKTGLE